MKIYALQTIRKGSKSIVNKNWTMFKETPLWTYNLNLAIHSKYINKLYISTDDQKIKKYVQQKNIWKNSVKLINRPAQLSTDNASHYTTILHGLFSIEKDIKDTVDILVILLGNNRGSYTTALNEGIKALIDNSSLDSVMSVGCYNMFNPYRSFKLNKKGCIETIIPKRFFPNTIDTKKSSNDKNAYGDIYFFNGSFFISRRKSIITGGVGTVPFPWLGKNIYPIIQDSEIMELDASWQIPLIQHQTK